MCMHFVKRTECKKHFRAAAAAHKLAKVYIPPHVNDGQKTFSSWTFFPSAMLSSMTTAVQLYLRFLPQKNTDSTCYIHCSTIMESLAIHLWHILVP